MPSLGISDVFFQGCKATQPVLEKDMMQLLLAPGLMRNWSKFLRPLQWLFWCLVRVWYFGWSLQITIWFWEPKLSKPRTLVSAIIWKCCGGVATRSTVSGDWCILVAFGYPEMTQNNWLMMASGSQILALCYYKCFCFWRVCHQVPQKW